MPGNKYLSNNAGQIQEVVSVNTSAGGADANKIIALNASGKIDASMLLATDVEDAYMATASENLAAGDNINVWNDGGSPKVRLADNSNNRPAHGFLKAAILLGATGLVYKEGTNDQLTGLAPGTVYFLGTAGGTTATAPTGTGVIVQRIGIAYSTTDLDFERAQPILLA